MSAVRKEYIGLHVNGQHVKSTPDVRCVNGGIAGGAPKKRPNRETIFLFTVILVQTICMVAGFIVFAYIVDREFDIDRKSRLHATERINSLSGELELFKKDVAAKSSATHDRIKGLNDEIERLEQEMAEKSRSTHEKINLVSDQLDLLGKEMHAKLNRAAQSTPREASAQPTLREESAQSMLTEESAPVVSEKLLDSPARVDSTAEMSDRIDYLSNEIELLKKNVGELELLKKNMSNRTVPPAPRIGSMPPLHGKTEVMKVVTVETVEEYPDMETMGDEKEYDDSDEDDDLDEEQQTADNADVDTNSNSGSAPTNLNADLSRLRDQQARNRLDLPELLGKQQSLAANSSTRNATRRRAPLGSPYTLVGSYDSDDQSDEDEGQQAADDSGVLPNLGSPLAKRNLHSNTSLLRDKHRSPQQRNADNKQQQQAANFSARNTSRQAGPLKRDFQRRSENANSHLNRQYEESPKLPVAKPKQMQIKDYEMLRRNTNREEDRGNLRLRRARSAPEKRHVNQVQDSGQPRLNSINPTVHSVAMDSIKDTSSNVWSWPAAHFNSYDLSSQRPSSGDDCPREIQNNQKKWAPSDVPGSENFDVKNYENITVKKEGLYFVYSQIYFYKDRSIFGYLIKRENEAVLQCSIHTPTNRTSNGSGTTCFTAGLVYLRTTDILRLEIFNESGKCVRWGPGKSFIGLYKLPQDSSTFL